MAASTTAKDQSSTPPPIITKAGRYTVFLTPPSNPKPPQNVASSEPPKLSPQMGSPKSLNPVQPPPLQFEKNSPKSSSSMFGFFWNAIARVQDAHSSLDEYLADWFGLDQSRYQWALNDYYESKGIEKEAAKSKDVAKKV